ncbi:CLUMA_CG006477, isoform A [Clunio marinus]|uniref:Derlin n=1 Tax=Clunio marinus TaxID=568069 RepID=A0A1J1I024_9DIPT|nr:CLUMA_CG006477, isoform A [Clunio marinus]
MSEFSTWYKSVPQFTRYWLTATVGISVLGKLGILPVQYLYLDSTFVFKKFQLWRLLTSVFFYPTGFHFLMNCFFLYNYSSRLEKDHYLGSPGDYLYLLTFNWLCCATVGIFSSLPFLMDPMVLSVLYVWCQLNKEVIVSFWFGTRFKAMYLPWVLLGFNMLMSNGSIFAVVGILVGHLYFFLKFTYPQELGGANFLETPQFIKNYYPDTRPSGVFGLAPEGGRADPQANQRRVFGGMGQRLGN